MRAGWRNSTSATTAPRDGSSPSARGGSSAPTDRTEGRTGDASAGARYSRPGVPRSVVFSVPDIPVVELVDRNPERRLIHTDSDTETGALIQSRDVNVGAARVSTFSLPTSTAFHRAAFPCYRDNGLPILPEFIRLGRMTVVDGGPPDVGECGGRVVWAERVRSGDRSAGADRIESNPELFLRYFAARERGPLQPLRPVGHSRPAYYPVLGDDPASPERAPS